MRQFVSADYFYGFSPWKRFLFVIDILLISLLYFMSGLALSAIYNDRFIKPLDRNQPVLHVFAETMAQGLVTIVSIYFLLHFLPKIPSLVRNPPDEHLNFRLRGADILLAFSIVACQLKYLDKLRFLYNEEEDEKDKLNDDIIENFITCQEGRIADSKDFSCQP